MKMEKSSPNNSFRELLVSHFNLKDSLADARFETLLLERMDLVREEFPNNFYWIDRFPMMVESIEKYSQAEVYFDKSIPLEEQAAYRIEEQKFINLIQKLWVYDSCYVESSLCYERNLNLTESQQEVVNRITQSFQSHTDELIELVDLLDLVCLAQLSLRGQITSCFYFPQRQVVLWISDLVICMYVADDTQKARVQHICNVEGLYVR